MPVIKTKTTYLEMRTPTEYKVAPPRTDIEVLRVENPSVEEYRRIYRVVGSDLYWVDRLIMPEEELREIIQHDRVDVYVLYADGKPGGYGELDRRENNGIEIAYFGLFPSLVGQGLGKYLLHWLLNTAWSHNPSRVWLHTCDLDHPAALPNYIKCGFEAYKEEMIDQWVPEATL